MERDFAILIELCIFVIIGALASTLLNLNEALTKNHYKFSTFVKLMLPSVLLNIFFGCLIITVAWLDNFKELEFTRLNAVILGAIAQQFFKKLCNIFSPYKNTYIGFNNSENEEPGEPSNAEESDTVDP